MTSSKKTIADKKSYAFNALFFRTGTYEKGTVRNSTVLDRFESVNMFYTSLEGSETGYKMNVKDCYALKLAGVIIDRLSSGSASVDREGSFGEDFYLSLAESVPADDSVNDNELVVIYLKQMMNIMKSCGLVAAEKGRASLSGDIHAADRLYMKLIKSFWNETDWASIFPSSPDTARALFDKREMFLDYLEGFYLRVSVEDFANDFFEMAGIAPSGDFFKISFLDFYLLTWLRHFGIIDYNMKSSSELVNIVLNDYGREVIKILA